MLHQPGIRRLPGKLCQHSHAKDRVHSAKEATINRGRHNEQLQGQVQCIQRLHTQCMVHMPLGVPSLQPKHSTEEMMESAPGPADMEHLAR